MQEYVVQKRKNKELIPLLRLDPVFQLYSLYVCEAKPEEESIVAVGKESGQLQAILVTGKPDLYIAAGYYMTAVNHDSAAAVLGTIREEKDLSLNYPIYLENTVKSVFMKSSFSRDCMYVYTAPKEGSLKENSAVKDVSVKHLTRELYESLDVDDRFHDMVMPQDLEPVSKFYGVTVGNKLVAIGEHLLENSVSCGISQVYTLEEYRGKGYASLLISHIAHVIRDNNKIPVYHFNAENIASKKACEHASFIEYMTLGYMELS